MCERLVLADTVTTLERPEDLRDIDFCRAVDIATGALGVRYVGAPGVKRRTLGGATTDARWLRIEARSASRVAHQGWGAIADAARVRGVAKPDWFRSVSWRDPVHRVHWRADEIELITEPVIDPSGRLHTDPGLGHLWWQTLTSSLRALQSQHAPRWATLGPALADQRAVTARVDRATDILGWPRVDSTIAGWHTAHADLTWANLTGPQSCWLLDWEDWGVAPRGFDAAALLVRSAAIPRVMSRVRAHFTEYLNSRDGMVSVLAIAEPLLADRVRAGTVWIPLVAETRRIAAALSCSR